ncbi:hypothetical protein [Pseudomonas sp.]|uniref:hypothetical protein n=1 Tax=Pseudomonas sp. TaxID=306 RepID=UPI002896F96B|nr:hypothetical protein [Pseudomonas sp.]
MKTLVIIIALIATLFTGFWAASVPNWDSIAALIASLVTFTSAFFLPGKSEIGNQTQTIGDSSNGIQAGRDVNIN